MLCAGAPFARERGVEGLPKEAVPEVGEEHNTAVPGPASPHRVCVLDPVFPHPIAGRVCVIGGDSVRIVGTIDTGYVPDIALSPDGSRICVAGAYRSCGTRGERTDVVTCYDGSTLEATGETVLPRGRFPVVPEKPDAALAFGGRCLLSFDTDPATTVSVVDVVAREYVTDIEVPGCALVFPTGERSFSMLCADGRRARPRSPRRRRFREA